MFQKLQDGYNKIPSWIRNKYVLALLVFVVWLIFFDRNNLIIQYDSYKKLKDLKAKQNQYKQQIESIGVERQALQNDTVALEKLAREKYLMKRDNEDLYIIVDDTTSH